ncbi:hypothetical protein ACFVVC_04550 [Pseudarthrobacter sp. NPDC058196]|uniref:hypothetical protein n=1 Tax=Pseudarthrobacter sp. NPDC058196 TaxID=3346376 RepID=UPI0036DDD015
MDEGIADVLGRMAPQDWDEELAPGLAFDERGDGRALAAAEDEVALLTVLSRAISELS